MNGNQELLNMLKRKLVSSICSSVLFSIVYGLINPTPFNEKILSIQQYFSVVIDYIHVYLMYSLPIFLIYGLISSFLCETFVNRAFGGRNKKEQFIFNGLIHLFFGLILGWAGVLASFIYFLIDQWFKKRDKILSIKQRILLFASPVIVWSFSVVLINLLDWTQR